MGYPRTATAPVTIPTYTYPLELSNAAPMGESKGLMLIVSTTPIWLVEEIFESIAVAYDFEIWYQNPIRS